MTEPITVLCAMVTSPGTIVGVGDGDGVGVAEGVAVAVIEGVGVGVSQGGHVSSIRSSTARTSPELGPSPSSLASQPG